MELHISRNLQRNKSLKTLYKGYTCNFIIHYSLFIEKTKFLMVNKYGEFWYICTFQGVTSHQKIYSEYGFYENIDLKKIVMEWIKVRFTELSLSCLGYCLKAKTQFKKEIKNEI